MSILALASIACRGDDASACETIGGPIDAGAVHVTMTGDYSAAVKGAIDEVLAAQTPPEAWRCVDAGRTTPR